MTFTLLRRGELIAVPPPEQCAASSWRRTTRAPGSRALSAGRVVGAPEKAARPAAGGGVESYGAEEAIVVSITYEHEARRRHSYELLAQAFDRQGRRRARDERDGARAMSETAPGR